MSGKLIALRNEIEGQLPNIKAAYSGDMDFFLQTVWTSIKETPKLMDCDKDSLVTAVRLGAQLGLPFDKTRGHAYLVPYKRKATLIPGYRGLCDLARKTGEVREIYAKLVYKGDTFEVKEGLHPDIIHIPDLDSSRNDADVTHTYAVAVLTNGAKTFEVMTRSEVDKISTGTDVWKQHYGEMARKTAVRRLCKYLPTNKTLDIAVALDEVAHKSPTDTRQQSDYLDVTADKASATSTEVSTPREGGEDTPTQANVGSNTDDPERSSAMEALERAIEMYGMDAWSESCNGKQPEDMTIKELDWCIEKMEAYTPTEKPKAKGE